MSVELRGFDGRLVARLDQLPTTAEGVVGAKVLRWDGKLYVFACNMGGVAMYKREDVADVPEGTHALPQLRHAGGWQGPGRRTARMAAVGGHAPARAGCPVSGAGVVQHVAGLEYQRATGHCVVVWDENSRPVRDRVQPLLQQHLGNICPPWCRELHVSYSSTPSENNGAMDMDCHPEYRWARMQLYPEALDADDQLFEKYTVHELFHLPLDPLMQLCHTWQAQFAPQHLQPYVTEQTRQAMEAMVCDATAAYLSNGHRLYPYP